MRVNGSLSLCRATASKDRPAWGPGINKTATAMILRLSVRRWVVLGLGVAVLWGFFGPVAVSASDPHHEDSPHEDSHAKADKASGEAEGESEDEPLVFEMETKKMGESPFSLKPGIYRITHHLTAPGPFSARVILIEAHGGIKKLTLIDEASRDGKGAHLKGEGQLVLSGRYELQYRFRGDDIAGELVFERIERSSPALRGFTGLYVGELEKVEQVGTLRAIPPIPRKRRASFAIREIKGKLQVEEDFVPFEVTSVKGSLLMAQGVSKDEPEGCEEERILIMKKRQHPNFYLREISKLSCPDGTFLWTEFDGTLGRE